MSASLWYTEQGAPHETHQFAIREVVWSGTTAFQDVTILDSVEYGRMLVVDGRTQSAEEDEHIYHESLVHPALTAHRAPRTALVIGGGEGATIREILRHPTIERVVMVDLDRELVERCRDLLPAWHAGAFDDPRVQMVFEDGRAFVLRTTERFDVVIVDVCDALEGGPALALYSEPFYRAVQRVLSGGGVLAVQAMELSTAEHADHVVVHQTLTRLFQHVSSYAVFIPSFWSSWGFVVAGDQTDIAHLASQEVDGVLSRRGLTPALRHYDGETHGHMFRLPKQVRAILSAEAARPKGVLAARPELAA